ncbi:MAG: hypothetical protein FWD45_01500 [Coriobacteriia bacterium]|nr:hypothetical protein [Coriobacteriia bacterium]
MEKAHRKLAEELELTEEVYNSKYISKLDDADNPLKEINRICFLLKRFLDSHSGFNRGDLDGYHNIFSVCHDESARRKDGEGGFSAKSRYG